MRRTDRLIRIGERCGVWAACFLMLSSVSLQASQLTQVPVANPSFEAPYNPVNDDHGQVTGMVANSWANNGGFGDVTAVYSQETVNCHTGPSCQKIVLSKVRSGNLQLLQGLSLIHI